ncbi:hypothetical protein E2I00_018304, partial [Balaenoptera physalus]
ALDHCKFTEVLAAGVWGSVEPFFPNEIQYGLLDSQRLQQVGFRGILGDRGCRKLQGVFWVFPEEAGGLWRGPSLMLPRAAELHCLRDLRQAHVPGLASGMAVARSVATLAVRPPRQQHQPY